MDYIRGLLTAGAAALAVPAFAQSPQLAHFESIYDWNVTARTSLDAAEAPALTAGFSAFGNRFDLTLDANIRVQDMVRTSGSTARAWRGSLRGRPESWVRIVTTADGPAGLIWDGTTLYGIEAGDSPQSATIFRADDVVVPPEAMSCGMHEPVEDAAAMFAVIGTDTPPIAHAVGATLNMNLGVVADSEFADLYADPAAAMLTRVNNIDGIFSAELGVQITVNQTDVFDDPADDPFTDTNDSEELLEELALYRGDTPAQDAQGLTHLFTGRELDGSTVGVAYIGAVCAQRAGSDPAFAPRARSFGAGLTQANFGVAAAFLESLIAAHEIGHNFGAPHDGEPGDCEAAPTGFLMSPSLDPTADEFSQCSIDVITAELPDYACLTPIADVDVRVSGASAASEPFTETQFDYTVTVENLGNETAAASTVDLSFDAAFTVVSVTPQSGTCGPAQADVTCSLGDIPGAASRTIAVRLSSATAGTRTISGTATATDDAFAGNNAFNDSVDVVAASDLALIAGAQSLTVETPTTLTATLENRSGIAASNVTLTGTWSDGIDVASAQLSSGTCTVDATARSFDCSIGQLTGQASATLEVVLTGTQTGNQVLTLNVFAQQSDPNAGNNAANVALTVSEPAPPPQATAPGSQDSGGGGGGGGGSLGPWSLLALIGIWRRRHRRSGKANFS